MNTERGICFNCQRWQMEVDALDKKHRQLTIMAAGQTGDIPVQYGKCLALKPPIGTLSTQPCIAMTENEAGQIKYLYSKIPVD